MFVLYRYNSVSFQTAEYLLNALLLTKHTCTTMVLLMILVHGFVTSMLSHMLQPLIIVIMRS